MSVEWSEAVMEDDSGDNEDDELVCVKRGRETEVMYSCVAYVESRALFVGKESIV